MSQPKWNTSGCTLTTTLGYDADGNLTSRAENAESGSCGTVAARTHTFTVDALGRPTVQVDDGGTTGGGTPWTDDRRILWTYDSQSGLDLEREIQKATGASSWAIEQKQVKTWFDNGLLKTLKTLGTSSNVLEEHTLSYETSGVFMDGFRTQDVFKLVGPSGQSTSCESSACTASWSYDARGRLTQEVTGTGTTSSFALDAVGNVTSETIAGTTTTKAYTGQQLTSTTTGGSSTYYLYDASGNLSCVAGNAGCTSGVVSKYDYDYRNRMTKETTGGGSSATYIHDPLDRPVAVLSGGSTVTRYYAGASTDVTKECVGACSSTSKSYGYTALGERIFLTENTSGSETRYSYGFDPHTSVTQLIDQSGAVKQSYGYTAYGSANSSLTKTASGFNSGVNPYRYTGHRLDALTGTMDMGARRYLPAAGRFIQQDMYYGGRRNLGLSMNAITGNRYGLAAGNPIGFVEIDGHYVANVNQTIAAVKNAKPGTSLFDATRIVSWGCRNCTNAPTLTWKTKKADSMGNRVAVEPENPGARPAFPAGEKRVPIEETPDQVPWEGMYLGPAKDGGALWYAPSGSWGNTTDVFIAPAGVVPPSPYDPALDYSSDPHHVFSIFERRFNKASYDHDVCYGSFIEGQSQRYCDDQFLKAMASSCPGSVSGFGSVVSIIGSMLCGGAALIARVAVEERGASSRIPREIPMKASRPIFW